MAALSERAGVSTVENVVVVIADSLRFDALPDAVANSGVTANTIAPSTATSSSVPSMLSGTYPSTNGVWTFEDVLARQPALFDRPDHGMTTRNIWQALPPAQRPPLRSLRLEGETGLDDVSPPFLVVIHDRGAHGPYDFEHNDHDRSDAFFRAYGDRTGELESMYRRGATTAGETFLTVRDRVDLADSLVVFTSDHGELLGEPARGGVFGHGTPMCPELVEVPTVFSGAGLPGGEQLPGLLSGIDLAPTLLGAQGRPIPDHVEGVDAWNHTPADGRVVRSEFWAPDGRLNYGAAYARSSDGGLVHHYGRAHERLAYAIHRQLVAGAQAPANRSLDPRALAGLVWSYGRRRWVHGDPDVDALAAAIPDEFVADGTDAAVDGPSEDQLRALGYIE